MVLEAALQKTYSDIFHDYQVVQNLYMPLKLTHFLAILKV